jgi:hypothetical protein
MHGFTASVRNALKIGWFLLAIVTTLLVCVEGLAFGYSFVRQTIRGYDREAVFARVRAARMPRDGYANPEDQTWFTAYWREFHESTYAAMDSISYSNWRRHPFKGKYINVDQDGRRVTWNQEPGNASGLIRVAVFGGATTWGAGARDDFTIPSYVSKLLAEKYPHRFTVVNYGQDGYVSTQEVIALLREIQSNHIPDLAIFYDGFDEVYAAYQAGAPNIPFNEDDRMREFNILHPSRARDFYFEALSRTNTFHVLHRLQTKLWPEPVTNSSNGRNNQALAADLIRIYLRNMEAVSAMEKEFGFAASFFWEPSVFTKSKPSPPEENSVRHSEPIAVIYRLAQEAIKQKHGFPPNVRDISNALDGYEGTSFMDTERATERANEMVAREIVASLKDTLEQAASRAPAADIVLGNANH